MRLMRRVGLLMCVMFGISLPLASQLLPEVSERPIRGAWLRPPATSVPINPEQKKAELFEAASEAGITDIYYETFFHGLATNDSDIFRNRFLARDELAETIATAAKYDIRIHAWLETAYWALGISADYILADNPDWLVMDDEGNTYIGDISTQGFVNIGHPEVQQVLADYCTELAANYPALWGIQTDYHRFPLDNDLTDNQIAPYSFDPWSREAFEDIYGVDPLTNARFPWNSHYDEFVRFRRDSIALAAKVMNDAIVAADPGKQFSGAIFPTAITTVNGNQNNSQFVKMQDWPQMAANGWLPIVVPMAYNSALNNIRNDLLHAVANASGNRVVPGLAIINPNNRPGVVQQLDMLADNGFGSFIFFEANALFFPDNGVDNVAAIQNHVAMRGPYMLGDFDEDGRIGANDLARFLEDYESGARGGVADLNRDRGVSEADLELMLQQFRAYRFGPDGVLGEAEYRVVLESFTDPAEDWPVHLFDLDGDGDVGCSDVRVMRTMINAPVSITTNPDVSGDGPLDAGDVNAFLPLLAASAPEADLNGDGEHDIFDAALYFAAIVAACP